jgi:glutamate-1-semialdehyde 2,1-aminomutase
MTSTVWLAVAGAVAAILFGRFLAARLLLSRAKFPSLQGHAFWGKRIARLVPFYEYGEDQFFDADGAPPAVASLRRAGFEHLASVFGEREAETAACGQRLESGISDLQFTRRYRVPFQFSRYAASRLRVGSLLRESAGVAVTNLDGQTAFDLTGSYGVNLFGYDFYKDCVDQGIARVRSLGPVLGAYHPVIEENVRKLKAISGLDEVSFHMSGTEAVMQAVRLARYHTGRSHLVRFCGAYHGWWDDVQPGLGSPATAHATYTLKDMSKATLKVLDSRHDIACVLVNPVQAMHPNASAPSDGTLIASDRRAHFDRQAYTEWLADLREVCTKRSIVLIFDEVFVGFRIAYGGAQEYFGVPADLVTYGKTLGGGLPVGVVCGKARYMKRFRDDRPSDVCLARGTFNSHPYVMGAMNEFLRRLDEPAMRRSYDGLDEVWNARANALNDRLAAEGLPVQVANLVSIWTVCYTTPSRYNWMFQYYLRAEGLALSWVGSGRLIFSHNYSDLEVTAVIERFVAAARAMRNEGWWWASPGLSNRTIKRQVMREMISVRVPWLDRRTAQAPTSGTIGSTSSPRKR